MVGSDMVGTGMVASGQFDGIEMLIKNLIRIKTVLSLTMDFPVSSSCSVPSGIF